MYDMRKSRYDNAMDLAERVKRGPWIEPAMLVPELRELAKNGPR